MFCTKIFLRVKTDSKISYNSIHFQGFIYWGGGGRGEIPPPKKKT